MARQAGQIRQSNRGIKHSKSNFPHRRAAKSSRVAAVHAKGPNGTRKEQKSREKSLEQSTEAKKTGRILRLPQTSPVNWTQQSSAHKRTILMWEAAKKMHSKDIRWRGTKKLHKKKIIHFSIADVAIFVSR